jgi:hypothetical protein
VFEDFERRIMDDDQERQDFALIASDAQLSADEEKLLDELGIHGTTRREFLGQCMAAVVGTFAFELLAKEKALAARSPLHPTPCPPRPPDWKTPLRSF